jgi:hypothetical protein
MLAGRDGAAPTYPALHDSCSSRRAARISRHPLRRLAFAVSVGLVIALPPAAAVLIAPTINPARAVAQGCSDSETEDSYSLQCVPNQVPDFSDQLTEAEVAEPGFNAGGASGGGGGHR